MKYYTFYRESNNFDDIRKDQALKSKITTTLLSYQTMILGLEIGDEHQIDTYVQLKYGTDIKTDLIRDFHPVKGIDYV